MFKWKITGKKSCKQEKLNNEVISKNARNNNAKLTAGNQLLERDKRNIVISEALPGSANVPHRVPTHPIPPEAVVTSHLPQDQPLPPHATYPTHNSPYSIPPMSSPASPIYAPLPHRQLQQGTTRPPPYIHPPNRPQPPSATIPTSCGPPPVAGPQQPITESVSATTSSSPYGLLPARTRQLKTSQATQAGDDSSHNTSINSSTTDNSKTEAGSASWMEWTQQLQAYVAWVNSQLRKRQGYRLVTDLRTDLHSGVVLADLVEIISSEKIAGVHRLPETAQIMRENVERVLQFMAAKRIRMHHVGSKEVVEGNLKAIMRLILALAAHYKPQSVRTSPYDSAATTTGQTPGATSASATTASANQASLAATSHVRASSRAPTTPSASLPTTPNKSTTTAPTGTPTGASTRPTNSLSACVTTPNLNVPGNRKSIGHLFETSGMSVAAPLRRFPSIAGHQWSHQWGGGVVSLAPDGDQVDVNVDVDPEGPGEPVPKRVGRRQWGQPGPPLYENLHRSSSFVGGYSGELRPRSQQIVQQKQQQRIREGIYDVPRTRPTRIEDPQDSAAEQPPMSPAVTDGEQLEDKHQKQLAVALPEDILSSSSADEEHHHHRREVSSSSCVQTTQTDTGGREGKEITDGYNSLPRNEIRPAALDFWESLTAIHRSPGNSSPNTSGEFRCNTIHRMSGRRKLPRIPYDGVGCDGAKSGDKMSAAASNGVRRASTTEEFEERSLGSRGEVEGSSSHGSPTTSIVRTREEAVAEWLRGSPGRRSDSWTRAEVGGGGGELWRNSALRRSTQLESWGRTQAAAAAPGQDGWGRTQATVAAPGQDGWGRTQATATASDQDGWGRTQAAATAQAQDGWGRTQATATASAQDSWGRTQATAPGQDGWGRTQATAKVQGQDGWGRTQATATAPGQDGWGRTQSTATASGQDGWGRSPSSATAVSSPIPATPVSGGRQEAPGGMSYDVLLEELAKARRQLVALQELVSLLNVDGRGGGPKEDFNFLKSQLQNTSERCDLLRQDLQQNQQGDAMSRLRAQEGEVQNLKKQLMSKDRLLQQQRLQFDDAVKAMSSNGHQAKNGQYVPTQDARLQNREEINILREAVHSLRISLKESDSNHHTLDTLEQCVAIVLERLIALENGRQGEMMAPLSPNKRAPISSFHGNSAYTKVVYYTEKTATPYLSSISKQLGEITLRDFKLVFDRAGSFRFHFKSMDPEFGMVKEEIASDDEILPGFDGKLIAWVQEDHGV